METNGKPLFFFFRGFSTKVPLDLSTSSCADLCPQLQSSAVLHPQTVLLKVPELVMKSCRVAKSLKVPSKSPKEGGPFHVHFSWNA